MTEMNIKTLKRVVVSLLVGAGVALGIPAAMADTGAGEGGGNSGGNLRGAVHWTSIAFDQKGKAWDGFLKFEVATGRGKSWVIQEVEDRVHSNKVCQNSNVIWYLKSTSTGKWVYNYSQATHGSKWNNYPTNVKKSSIEKPHEVRGQRAPLAAEIRAFKDWDKSSNGGIINGIPGYVIICSGAYNNDGSTPPDKVRTEPETRTEKNQVSYTFDKPHSYSTSIMPQLSEYNKDGKLVDPIGKDNLEIQEANNSRTNYGVAIDKIANGSLKGNMNTVKSNLESAIAKDEKLKVNNTRDLSANNQAGMAEGGILNVSGFENWASITVTRNDSVRYDRTCTYRATWNSSKGKFNAEKKTCTAWKKKTTNGTPHVIKTKPTQKNSGFWQMLSVHCNAEDFKALANSGNGVKTISQGNTNNKVAAAVNSKVYQKRPTVLDFGDKRNSNAAKKATANLGFYDKECPFDCTPAKSTSSGASSNNGAVNNSGNTGKKGADKYGATSGGLNNNSFDFFRDNGQKDVKVDVWYPANVSGVSYKGQAPKTTTVTRWAEGTPGTTGKNGGKFAMKTKSGTTLFNGKTKEAAPQKNWSTDTFDTANSTSLPGLHNEFTVQASWASEKDKPQQLNVKYEYEANVSTVFYGKGLGFTKDGSKVAQRLGTTVNVAAPIEGKCYVNYGTNDDVDTTKVFHDNTGSGTKNNLDGQLLEGPGNKAQKTNLVVRFVRATAE